MSHSIIRDLFYSAFPDAKKYLTYGIGNSPILLSAGHGGGIIPLGLKQRTYGNRSKDSYTRRLIQRVIELLPDTNKPFYIYSNIHRKIVDLNREVMEATQGNQLAGDIWNTWHTYLRAYSLNITNKYGKGLYIDIHSHNKHDEFEMGYGLITKDYLSILNGKPTKKRSYMYSLKEVGKNEYSTLFGEHSFPNILTMFEYKVLVPEKDETYLNGGYNIKHHSGNEIGAMQIECPIPVLKYDLEGVAQAITNGIVVFQERFLG
jgi:hypothetical protein